MNSDLASHVNTFGIKCLHRPMGYHWNDFASHQWLHETESRPTTSLVHECQLQLYGHVARFLDVTLVRVVLYETTLQGVS